MDFSSISIILLGSTFGLRLRIFIQNKFKKSIGFDIQNTSIVNFLSSFFLGILVALNFINNEILVLFYGGFLGCFSTFSAFIYQPSQRKNSKEAFRGFINLFDDYLATDLFDKVNAPIQLIWGEKDPWESLNEAIEWKKQFRNIERLDIINGAGHCPHDEEPEKTNKLINEFIQETK